MQVLKFGGSSVANSENIRKVKDIIQLKKGAKTVVIVSALGGVTDELLKCGTLAASGDSSYKENLHRLNERHLTVAKELLPLNNQSGVLSFVMQQFNEVEDICNGIFLLNDFTERTKDRILSYGELISSKIISSYLATDGLQNKWIDARKLVLTDSQHTRAVVQFEKTQQNIQSFFSDANEDVFVVPGFVAADEKENTTTLGRGGSDYTAAIIAAALNASAVEIWTDVSGMMTADPRLVTNAKAIQHISYQEAMELISFWCESYLSANHSAVMNKNIPVWIKNTFASAR